jgi:hypothetical protein
MSELLIGFDDVDNHRIQLKFSPCQAVRVTTVDCFDVNALLINGRLVKRVLEVTESGWIRQLQLELERHDRDATFLQTARHFILPFQDNIVEVVAWQYVRLSDSQI